MWFSQHIKINKDFKNILMKKSAGNGRMVKPPVPSPHHPLRPVSGRTAVPSPHLLLRPVTGRTAA